MYRWREQIFMMVFVGRLSSIDAIDGRFVWGATARFCKKVMAGELEVQSRFLKQNRYECLITLRPYHYFASLSSNITIPT